MPRKRVRMPSPPVATWTEEDLSKAVRRYKEGGIRLKEAARIYGVPKKILSEKISKFGCSPQGSTAMSGAEQVPETQPETLGSLLDAGNGALVTLVAGDTRLVAHRAILAARSPVFAAMLGHDTQEASSGEVIIDDVEGPVLRQLLEHLYTLQMPRLLSATAQLLAAADKYGMSELKTECELQLVAQLSVGNAAALGVLAVRYSCPDLTEATVSFIKDHSADVLGSQWWNAAVVAQPLYMGELKRLVDKPPETRSFVDWCAEHFPEERGRSSVDSGDTHMDAPSPVPPMAARRTAQLDEEAVSFFRRLSTEEKDERLIDAARLGTAAEVRALLAAGADVLAADESGQTALHTAAANGDVEMVSAILAVGVDEAVRARDRDGWTALHHAADRGHVEVVRRLLPAMAVEDVNLTEQRGWTALHIAASHGSLEMIRSLVVAGADLETENNRYQTLWNLMWLAAGTLVEAGVGVLKVCSLIIMIAILIAFALRCICDILTAR